MRDGALLVNAARGPVVDTAALLAELQSGRLRAAVDVTDPEPLPADHPLWQAPNLLLTPHVAGSVLGLPDRFAALLVAQLRRFEAGEPLENVVTGRVLSQAWLADSSGRDPAGAGVDQRLQPGAAHARQPQLAAGQVHRVHRAGAVQPQPAQLVPADRPGAEQRLGAQAGCPPRSRSGPRRRPPASGTR